MAFSSSLACLLLLRVLNTTAGPTSLHTTVQQIPGKYELVSTCTAQTNTGPLFFSFLSPPPLVFSFLQHKYLKTTPRSAEWQEQSNGGRCAEWRNHHTEKRAN